MQSAVSDIHTTKKSAVSDARRSAYACHGVCTFNLLILQIYKAFRVKPAVLAYVLRCCGANTLLSIHLILTCRFGTFRVSA